ncbi:MAG: ComF family protein [Marmoricola sp.]
MRDAFCDLLLGGRCAGCGVGGRVLCADCREDLPMAGRPSVPEPAPAGLPPVFTAGEYADLLRRLVLAHKEHRAFGLAVPLGVVLAAVLADALADLGAPAGTRPLLVPVPSSRSATRARGHDPVRRMVIAAARAARGPTFAAPLLRVARKVADQAGLDARQRAANLDGRLAVSGRQLRLLARSGGPVLPVLCDDVLTTGATLAEAQRALTAVGLPAALAVTVAATRKRLPLS